MKNLKELESMWPRDPNMRQLVISLWREYYGLYTEKYDRDPEKWLLNSISKEIDFGQAIGQDHRIDGNLSVALGIGAITRSFRETALGSYGTADSDPLAMPNEWRALDRLISVGKGINDENREDALVLFKSGLLKLFNAFRLGKYDHQIGRASCRERV